MKNILIPLLIILVFAGCKKDDESMFIDEPADEVTRYVIHLSGTKITEYKTYINDTLKKVINFYFSDSTAEVITKDENGKMVAKTVYQLNEDGLAVSSVDSIFSENGFTTFNTEFKYSEGFMIERTIYYENELPVIIRTTIENENIIEVEVRVNNHSCFDYYGFTEMINKIDLYFSNGITGKWSKNLADHVSWNNNCPCGPSMTTSKSEYRYELDADGYVVKEVEIFTRCYHLPASGKIKRTIYTTFYEYIKN